MSTINWSGDDFNLYYGIFMSLHTSLFLEHYNCFFKCQLSEICPIQEGVSQSYVTSYYGKMHLECDSYYYLILLDINTINIMFKISNRIVSCVEIANPIVFLIIIGLKPL